MSDPIVALEIGTSKICALVGEEREDGNIMVIGMGVVPSVGVRKGIIIDYEKVVASVKTAVQTAEQTGETEIRQAYLAVNGGHVRGLVNQGSSPVGDPVGGIVREDIEEVMAIARAVNLPHDALMIHTIPQRYAVDGQGGIVNPEGMRGAKLSLDMLVVHGARNMIHNGVNAVKQVGVDVQDVAFSGLCSALATLTPEQKESGVALIDLGAGTTTYAVYAANTIAMVGVLAVGGDHITNDIAQAFTIPMTRAEALKHEHGVAVPDASAHFQRLSIPAEVGFPASSVSASDLHAVIHARVDETFALLKRECERQGVMHHLDAGIVLCGGGARMIGVEGAAERVFDMPCTVGKPRNFSGIAAVHEAPEFAVALGALRFAVAGGRRKPEPVSLGGWIKTMFGGAQEAS